jgi:hypothetical protein
MFAIALKHDDHTRNYRVTPAQQSGWELTLTEDLTPIRHVHYEDWHRVERALAALQLEIRELTARGWHVDPENRSLPPSLQS